MKLGGRTYAKLNTSRSPPSHFGRQVYNAVHMPYVMSLYSLGTVGCLALGFCVIREIHEKINGLLGLTPVESSKQKTLLENDAC